MEKLRELTSDETILINGGDEATEGATFFIAYILAKIVKYMPETPPNMGRL